MFLHKYLINSLLLQGQDQVLAIEVHWIFLLDLVTRLSYKNLPIIKADRDDHVVINKQFPLAEIHCLMIVPTYRISAHNV